MFERLQPLHPGDLIASPHFPGSPLMPSPCSSMPLLAVLPHIMVTSLRCRLTVPHCYPLTPPPLPSVSRPDGQTTVAYQPLDGNTSNKSSFFFGFPKICLLPWLVLCLTIFLIFLGQFNVLCLSVGNVFILPCFLFPQFIFHLPFIEVLPLKPRKIGHKAKPEMISCEGLKDS